jgi:hypothetical protein
MVLDQSTPELLELESTAGLEVECYGGYSGRGQRINIRHSTIPGVPVVGV